MAGNNVVVAITGVILGVLLVFGQKLYTAIRSQSYQQYGGVNLGREEECAYCLNPLTENIVPLNCGHMVHKNCPKLRHCRHCR